MKKILLTGATGRIGRDFHQLAADRYALRLTSRDAARIDNPGPHETMSLDLADLDACRRACDGIHTVLHLAADADAGADFYATLLDANIVGAYNIFRAAKEMGCRRVVFASTIQVIEGYPLDVQGASDRLPKPVNMYGVSKVFGEALAHYFAVTEGLSSIVVRVGSYEGNGPWENPNARQLSAFISRRDMFHMFERCIEAEDVQFGIVQAVSDNRFKRMDITSARDLVGYAPQDDAFTRFNTGIPYRDRWYEEGDRTRPGIKNED